MIRAILIEGGEMGYIRNIFLLLCIFNCFVVLNAADSTSIVCFVDDIPMYCASLAQRLKATDVFADPDKGNDFKSYPLLSIESWADCRICDIVSKNAFRVRPDVWKIRDFGCGSRTRFSQRTWARWGIELYDGGRQCSLNELQLAYEIVIARLKNGWTEVSLDNYRGRVGITFGNGWRLFIKKQSLIEESMLINLMASRFAMNNYIECGNFLEKSHDGYVCTDILYLVIKSEQFDVVQKVFGLKIN